MISYHKIRKALQTTLNHDITILLADLQTGSDSQKIPDGIHPVILIATHSGSGYPNTTPK
jgi:hypothetical protein